MESFKYVHDANIEMSRYESWRRKNGVLGVIQEYINTNNRESEKAKKAKIVKEFFRYIFRDDVFNVIERECGGRFLETIRDKLLELIKEPELRCLRRYAWFYNNDGRCEYGRAYNFRDLGCVSYANMF